MVFWCDLCLLWKSNAVNPLGHGLPFRPARTHGWHAMVGSGGISQWFGDGTLVMPQPYNLLSVGATAVPNSRVNSPFSVSIQTEQSLVYHIYLHAASWIYS